MPPKRTKKNASTASEDAMPSQPAQQEEARTPEQSPQRQSVGITQAQKQALMDNLQLEITERARKLRAQYALQAQGLRSRLEMRVNRIPTALRKRKMQDLLDEHAEKAEPKPVPAVPAKETVKPTDADERPKKAAKRKSEHISTDYNDPEDKENAAPAASSQDLPMAKKRAKAAPAANTKAARTASRAAAKPLQPSGGVLSPKSHNSRTLPRSPIKNSPEKRVPSRPVNTAKPAAARTASRQQGPAAAAKRLAPTDRDRSSGGSDSSAGTTIVHKAATGAKGRVAAAAKKTTAAVGRATGAKKGATATAGTRAKKENAPPATTTAAAGRTLRKRG